MESGMHDFAPVANGPERWASNVRKPRHRHAYPYAAIVLAGGYEECGSDGRFRVGPGDVLLHGPFHAHLDRFMPTGAEIFNLPLHDSSSFGCGVGRIADPDAIVRSAETDPAAAEADLIANIREVAHVDTEWPDLLASDLLKDPELRLDAWASDHGLAAETLSRGFSKLFGLTPANFRVEARTLRAFDRIISSTTSLCEISALAGFADQSHMTRAIKTMTGVSPGHWRASISFKTVAAGEA
jgi:AraC-like DNA-binding protein